MRSSFYVAFAAALLCVLFMSAPTTAARPLVTAMDLTNESATADFPAAVSRVSGTGATAARVFLIWPQVAPGAPPASPTDPSDPAYRWAHFDSLIRQIVGRHLEPMVTIYHAPLWAQAPGTIPRAQYGPDRPDPVAFGQFARAAALRYSGRFQGLPRVRYWEAWNEPNLSLYLTPQLVDGKPVSPGWYRRMLHEFAVAVHGVRADNVVIGGALAPFRDPWPEVQAQRKDWGPLSFMRELLCLSPKLVPTCSDRADFDVWSTHPYTSGGPTHHAVLPNDVSLGDLPQMTRTLRAAVKAGHVSSHGAVRFWVTEFSWDSRPPDPEGVPIALLQRWIPEALYRMWLNGVDRVVWLQLKDDPLTSIVQAGFYFRSPTFATAKVKPTLEGFRFPFVALRRGARVDVWARTPAGRRARLVVEQRVGSAWRKVATHNTDRFGILALRVDAKPVGSFRARMFPSGEASLAFSMKVPRDRFYNPFGQTHISDGP